MPFYAIHKGNKIGIFNFIDRVNLEEISTCLGKTDDFCGTSNTSSKVNAILNGG